MKNITKLVLSLLVLLSFTGCKENDPINDWARIGQQPPHVIWELKSKIVKAGDSLEFNAKYYTNGVAIDHTEIWYDLTENVGMKATCPLVSFNYSLAIDHSTLVREDQEIAIYAHSEKYWDSLKRAYTLSAKCPISNTLRPVEWKEVVMFDTNKYSQLFPSNFSDTFKKGLFEQLEKKEHLSDYRVVLVAVGNMKVEEFDACLDSVYNQNSAKFDKFIKESKTSELKTKYDAIPFKELIYKSLDSKYQIQYVKSYVINANFRAIDTNKKQGTTEKFSIQIN